MKFSIKDFLGKCDQICNKLRIWRHLPKKSLMDFHSYVEMDATIALSQVKFLLLILFPYLFTIHRFT